MLLLSDGSVTWDCHIYHHCPLLLLVIHHYDWIVSQTLLVSLDLKVPQDFCFVCSIPLLQVCPIGTLEL